MKLSREDIEICRFKCRKSTLIGFEKRDAFPSGITEEEADAVFDRLTGNSLIEVYEENIRLSAFGHFLINTMSEPEQFVMLENESNGTVTRIYFRNAFYLWVFEHKKKDGTTELVLELLPDLKMVVGALVTALRRRETDKENRKIRITGKAWNREGELASDLMINGKLEKERTQYQIEIAADSGEVTEQETEICDLVNLITMWVFGRISERIAEKSVERYEKVR
ncbi:MAG: hypothetical protein IKO11_02655 [Lachnospiraceae bacterium]|nr:hypothetical protein [Lachnospiraceae bacterium]